VYSEINHDTSTAAYLSNIFDFSKVRHAQYIYELLFKSDALYYTDESNQ
jgi:hypothetical protein